MSPTTLDRAADAADAGADTDALDELRALLTLTRTHPSDFKLREVIYHLDGGKRQLIMFGDTITFELKPGRHQFRAHNTLMRRTIDFTIETGEHLELLIINSGRWWTYAMAGILGSAPLFLRIIKRSLV